MRKRGDGLGFTFEPRATIGIARETLRQNLDGDIAIEPGVPCPVHLTHAARTKRREDFILAETGTCRKAHVGLDYDLLCSSIR